MQNMKKIFASSKPGKFQMQCREEAEDACGSQPRAFFVWHSGFWNSLNHLVYQSLFYHFVSLDRVKDILMTKQVFGIA